MQRRTKSDPSLEIYNIVKQPKTHIGVFLKEPFSESQVYYKRRFLGSKANGTQESAFKIILMHTEI